MSKFELIDAIVWVLTAFVSFTWGGNISRDWQQKYFLPIVKQQTKVIDKQHKIINEQKEEITKLKAKIQSQKIGKRGYLPSRHANFSLNRGSEFTATAYTHTGNNTASGVYPSAGKTIAVDRRVIPMGSKVKVTCDNMPQYNGIYTAEDTGGAIKGKIIDIFVDSRSEAINFGRRHIKVEVIK